MAIGKIGTLVDDGDFLDSDELEEIPTAASAWRLDFKGSAMQSADKNPEAVKAALTARLARIDKAGEGDFWAELLKEVPAKIEALVEDDKAPSDATHKLVGGLFEGSYVKDPQLSEDRQGFWVTFVEGVRKDRRVLTSFADLVNVDGFPDLDLEKMLAPGKTGSYIGPRPRRK